MPNQLIEQIRARLRSFVLGPGAVDPWTTVHGLPSETYTPAEYGDYLASSNGVYSCATLRADLLSSLPLKLYRGEGDKRKEVEAGPLRDLLNRVNPYWTRHRLMSMTELSLCLWGEAFWFLERGGRGVPREIWWGRPDRVKVVPDADNYLKGFLYQPQHGLAEIAFTPTEVIWLRFPNPMDEFDGLSPLAAARLAADTASAAMHSNRNLFKHGIQMGGMLLPPKGGTFTPDQAQSLEKSLERRFSGAENAHRWAVFPFEYQIETPTVTPKDAEFLGAMKWSLEDICRAYKVPLDLLGGERTYENANAAMKAMWTNCILPEARFIATEITEQLLPMFPGAGVDSVDFDSDDVDVLQEGHAEKWTRAKEQITTGTITVNEWRKAEGLTAVPWGDVWWAPSSLTPVENAEKPEPPPVLAVPPDEGQQETQPKEPPKEKQPPKVQKKALAHVQVRIVPPYGSLDHARLYQRWQGRADPHEKAVAAMCADLFKRQKDSIIGRLKAPGRDIGDVVDMPFNLAEWRKKFRIAARPVFAEIVRAIGMAALEDLTVKLSFNVFEPMVVRFLERRAQRFAQEVNQTTWDMLKASLGEGIEVGDGMDAMTERVEAVMGERIRSSAETIARTEVNGAANGGTLLAWKQSGVVEGKEWLAALDDRTRDDHVDAHGQVVGLDEDFDVGGARGPCPGSMGDPAQDCNCRCTIIAKIKGETE